MPATAKYEVIGAGVAFVLMILGATAFSVWLSTHFNLDRADYSLGAFGAIAVLFLGAIIASKSI